MVSAILLNIISIIILNSCIILRIVCLLVVVIDVDGQRLLFVNIWLHYLPDSFEDIKKLIEEITKLRFYLTGS